MLARCLWWHWGRLSEGGWLEVQLLLHRVLKVEAALLKPQPFWLFSGPFPLPGPLVKMENSWPFPRSPVVLQALCCGLTVLLCLRLSLWGQSMWSCCVQGDYLHLSECHCIPLSHIAQAVTTSLIAASTGMRSLCCLWCCCAGMASSALGVLSKSLQPSH